MKIWRKYVCIRKFKQDFLFKHEKYPFLFKQLFTTSLLHFVLCRISFYIVIMNLPYVSNRNKVIRFILVTLNSSWRQEIKKLRPVLMALNKYILWKWQFRLKRRRFSENKGLFFEALKFCACTTNMLLNHSITYWW